MDDALLLTTPRYKDARGVFMVAYEASAATALGLPHFVQDNHSVSKAVGTVRGLHLQLPPYSQSKLVRVLAGRVADVIVDLRPGSKSFGRYEIVELNAYDRNQLLIPAGFCHGFCTLEPDSEVFYKVDKPYRPEAERTLAWDDPSLDVDWPIDHRDVVLSEKDAQGISLKQMMAAIEQAVS